MSEERAPKIKLGGLWKQESKDGTVYYSGSLTYSTNILLFKNQYKKSEKDPDLLLYLAQKLKKEKKEDDDGL